MFSNNISVHFIEFSGNSFHKLLAFGLELPILEVGRKRLVLKDGKQYTLGDMLKISENEHVRHFLADGKTRYRLRTDSNHCQYKKGMADHKCNAAANRPPKLCLLSSFFFGGARQLAPLGI